MANELLGIDKFLDALKEVINSRVTSSTKFFGFSSFFNFWNDNLTNLTHWMKQKYPNIKIVLGGQTISLTPAPTQNIDYWIDDISVETNKTTNDINNIKRLTYTKNV